MKFKTKCLVDFDADQLKRVIELAKKGIASQSDSQLLVWLERKLETASYRTYPADRDEIDIDAIPF
jgi:hypothetical protein